MTIKYKVNLLSLANAMCPEMLRSTKMKAVIVWIFLY